MKITITGSLGNVGKRLTEQLTAKGHRVTVISHNPKNAQAIQDLQAVPAIGSVDDYPFLVDAFRNADAVFTMVPPDLSTDDYDGAVRRTGSILARALAETSVPFIVNLSSIGAHSPDRNGPSGAFYYEEKELNELEKANVLHLRAGMFYTNFYGSIGMIKHMGVIGNNFGGKINLTLTHPHDIADMAASALDKLSFTGKSVRYVVSEERSGEEIAQLLGDAIGKPELQWVTFSDEELLQGMMQGGFSRHMASKFVELGISIKEGRLWEDYLQNKPREFGKKSFEDFAKEFAMAYEHSN